MIDLLIALLVFGTVLSIFGLLIVFALPNIIAGIIGSALADIERKHDEPR